MKGTQSQLENNTKPQQPEDNINGGCEISQAGESGVPSQGETNGKCKLDCKILLLILVLIAAVLIVYKCWSSVMGICLAVFLCICYIVFCCCAYKCPHKDKLSCTISWLVGLSLLFILIIVIGLFADTFSGFSVTVSKICIFNGSTITLTSVLLFILSILISILSGNVVYQKGKENRQKQQDITGKIEKLDNILKQIYGEGKPNG